MGLSGTNPARSRSVGKQPLAGTGTRLSLLGGWRLQSEAESLRVQPASQRLLAYVALTGRVNRQLLSGTLWPEVSDAQARSSLRSTLWRLQRAAPQLVVEDDDDLTMSPDVRLDVAVMVDIARAALLPDAPTADAMLQLPGFGELLPGWYDDWVLIERERLRELRLHALEALTMRLIESSRYAEAVDAALAAAASDPLRESAHRAVVGAYLAEGNHGAALRHYEDYRVLLREELDLDPSPAMLELVRRARQHTRR